MNLGNEIKFGNINDNWLFDITTNNQYCLNFDGSDDLVDFGDILDRYDSFTIESWIRPDSINGTFVIVSLGADDSSSEAEATNTSFQLAIEGNGSTCNIKLFYEYGTGTNETHQHFTSGVTANTWTHLAVTRDNSDNKIRFYKDGVLLSTTVATNDPSGGTSTDMKLRIGVSHLLDNYFDGDIAQLRIFNTARTDNEIATFYNDVVDSSTTGLVADWKLNEGGGTTVGDDSSQNNSGTISGASWVQDFDQFNETLRLSFSDVTDSSNFYHGAILNKPSIRESISLLESKFKSSNISLQIADFKYKNGTISNQLFKGRTAYINADVNVYSKINSSTKYQIGSFRLTDLSTNGNTISASLTSQRPWDYITFPQEQESISSLYVPVVYGSYTPNESTLGNEVLCGFDLYPVEVLDSSWDYIITLMPRSYSSSSKCRINMHVGNENFVPLSLKASPYTTIDTTSTRRQKNVLISQIGEGYVFTGTIVPTENEPDENPATDSYLTFDRTKTTEGGSKTLSAGSDNNEMKFGAVACDKNFFRQYIRKFIIKLKSSNTSELLINLACSQWLQKGISSFGGAFDPSTADTIETHSFSFASPHNTTDTSNNMIVTVQGTESPYATVTVTEILSNIIVEPFEPGDTPTYSVTEQDSNLRGDSQSLDNIKYFYSGGDGLQHGITGLAGTDITEIHEAHLDLLNRFAGVDVATNPATNITGWSDLNNDKDWKIKYWKHKPVELKAELEKLQYEGGFIFKFGADGSPRYIHIKDSYSASDLTYLSSADITDIELNITTYSELLTKMLVNYQINPATNNHTKTATATNHQSRGKYNIQEKENTSDVTLNHYYTPEIPSIPSSNPNDDFYTYYDNLHGDIKMIVSGKIVNPKYFELEVGDVIGLEDMYPDKFFAKSFTNVIFMITSTSRNVGSINFTAREIATIT